MAVNDPFFFNRFQLILDNFAPQIGLTGSPVQTFCVDLCKYFKQWLFSLLNIDMLVTALLVGDCALGKKGLLQYLQQGSFSYQK